MKHLLASTYLVAGLLAMTGAARAECGNVTIAGMDWQSAGVLAALDKFILTEGYGCKAEVVVGDTVPTITGMIERGEPDLAPEGWVDLLPDVVNGGLAEGKLVGAAVVLSDGAVQGWWIPKYIVDANPEIRTIADALKRPDLFPDPAGGARGAVHNGPQGWGGAVVTSQFYKAYGGAAANFALIDAGSAAGLDDSIAKAYGRRVGWIGYYWAPTALLGRYDMVKLEHGVPYDAAEWKRCNTVADCADPKKNDWPKDKVQTLVTRSFSERAGAGVMDYLNRRSWSNDTVNRLTAWMTENQASSDDGARHFLKENEVLWKEWVSPQAAEKIKSAL